MRIYSKSDGYSGHALTNPTVPAEYLNNKSGKVCLERHVVVGSGSVILPCVSIKEGNSVETLSLVQKNLDEWGVYFGAQAKRLKS